LQKIAFTTELSDGTLVKLIEEGDDEYVNEENSQKYVDLVLSTRFQESNKQMNAIKAGFDVVFPSEVARVLDWEDVAKRVRGYEFDFEKLKTITDYDGLDADDEWGTYFWNIIKNLSPETQTRYLRSAVGRTRLHLEPRLSEIKHKVNLRNIGTYTDHDQHEVLFEPESFSIHLPRYTTEEIMKKNILEAISKTERY
jgi:hypothetical protein